MSGVLSAGSDVASASLKVAMNFDTVAGTLTPSVILTLSGDAFDLELALPEQYEKLMEMWRGYRDSSASASLGADASTNALAGFLDESSDGCPEEGFLGMSGSFSVNAGNVKLAGTGSGKYMCKDPGDASAPRFSLALDELDEIAFLDGALTVSDVTASVVATGIAGSDFTA